jgi:TolA-binding protein
MTVTPVATHAPRVVPAAPVPVAMTAAPPAPAAPAAPAAPIATLTPAEEAAQLFDTANEARRKGEYARTLALHRELQARFGQSREAHLSRATVGRLLLDSGDPADALTSFDAYLNNGGGELGAEVMAGRATALERLGRADDARRAWDALLSTFPSTPYAAHAAHERARLGAPRER